VHRSEPKLNEEKVGTRQWYPHANQFYCGKSEPGEPLSIYFLDLATGEKTEVFRHKLPVGIHSRAVSPDGKWIYFACRPEADFTDLWLTENFQ
jgi:hypothetical protein